MRFKGNNVFYKFGVDIQTAMISIIATLPINFLGHTTYDFTNRTKNLQTKTIKMD